MERSQISHIFITKKKYRLTQPMLSKKSAGAINPYGRIGKDATLP